MKASIHAGSGGFAGPTDYAAFLEVDSARARRAGLQSRELRATVADTLAWWRGLDADARSSTKAGLSPQREAAVLAAITCSR